MMVDIETCIHDKHLQIVVEINGLAEIMRVGGKWSETDGGGAGSKAVGLGRSLALGASGFLIRLEMKDVPTAAESHTN